MAQFSQEYPKVKVKIKSGTHEDLFQLLRDDQIDLDFSDQRRVLSPEYQNKFLTETDFMAVVLQTRFSQTTHLFTAELEDLSCILVVGEAQAAQEEAYCRNVLGIKSQF